jgi:hypothetical protein
LGDIVDESAHVVDRSPHVVDIARKRFEALGQSLMPLNQSIKPLVNVHIAMPPNRLNRLRRCRPLAAFGAARL